MPLRVNLVADDTFRTDLQAFCREQLRPLAKQMIEELVVKEFEKYIASHELASLVPEALKKAAPDLLKQSWAPLEVVVKATTEREVARIVTDAYIDRMRPQIQSVVNAMMKLRFK
jgi:hypothetical protein